MTLFNNLRKDDIFIFLFLKCTSGSPQIPAALLWVPWPFSDSRWTGFFGDLWWIFMRWDQKWLYCCKYYYWFSFVLSYAI